MKEFATNEYTKTNLYLTFETFEKQTAAVSECGLIWHTADSCQRGNWWMETTSPGLCPWNGMPLWTFVAI